jgi:integrase
MNKQRILITGEGSIIEVTRGRLYRIRHRIPPEKPGGKARWSPMRSVHGTKADARQALEEYCRELEDRLNNKYHGLTVGQYGREFQARRLAMNTLSPLTLRRDELETSKIERHFGTMPIQELTTGDINAAYSTMRVGEGMSAGAIHKVHAKLRQILKQAVKDGMIVRNPCDTIEDIKRPPAEERRSLAHEQALQLASDLKTESPSGNIVAVWLALATGVRRGEALGLVWHDVDLRKGRIHISKQYAADKKRRAPKSESSKRNLSIDKGTVVFLTEWKAVQSKEFFDGEDVPGDTPVCTNELGNFIDPDVFNRWRRNYFADHGLGSFKKTVEYTDRQGQRHMRRSGYEGFNLHELRHTQATLLIGSGTDIKTVQKRLGHSSASLTLNIYAHAIEQNDREAAEMIGSLLHGQQ